MKMHLSGQVITVTGDAAWFGNGHTRGEVTPPSLFDGLQAPIEVRFGDHAGPRVGAVTYLEAVDNGPINCVAEIDARAVDLLQGPWYFSPEVQTRKARGGVTATWAAFGSHVAIVRNPASVAIRPIDVVPENPTNPSRLLRRALEHRSRAGEHLELHRVTSGGRVTSLESRDGGRGGRPEIFHSGGGYVLNVRSRSADTTTRPYPATRQLLDEYYMPAAPAIAVDETERLERLRARRGELTQAVELRRAELVDALVADPNYVVPDRSGTAFELEMLSTAIATLTQRIERMRRASPDVDAWRIECARRITAWWTAKEPRSDDTPGDLEVRVTATVAGWG